MNRSQLRMMTSLTPAEALYSIPTHTSAAHSSPAACSTPAPSTRHICGPVDLRPRKLSAYAKVRGPDQHISHRTKSGRATYVVFPYVPVHLLVRFVDYLFTRQGKDKLADLL